MNTEGVTTPEDLAVALGVTGRRLRAWLRQEFPRSPAEHGTRWHLDEHMVRRAMNHFDHR